MQNSVSRVEALPKQSPPLLSPSKEGKDLFLYLAVSVMVVSAALIREENKVQLPVYYAYQAFQGAEAGRSPSP